MVITPSTRSRSCGSGPTPGRSSPPRGPAEAQQASRRRRMRRYCGQPWWSTADFTIRPGSFSQVELRGLEPLTPCLQSMAKMSSTVHGLARSALIVQLSTTTSSRVGVDCGCHRGLRKGHLQRVNPPCHPCVLLTAPRIGAIPCPPAPSLCAQHSRALPSPLSCCSQAAVGPATKHQPRR
jgi:hypothetical protein